MISMCQSSLVVEHLTVSIESGGVGGTGGSEGRHR